MAEISGVWLPVVTPFIDGAVDVASYDKLLEHYLAKGVAGIFPLGTTGESPTIDDDEIEAIVDRTVNVVAGRADLRRRRRQRHEKSSADAEAARALRVRGDRLRLAELPNIVGVKDSSGNLSQSLELLRLRPEGFAVMTGDDPFFYTMLAHGGDGGILASSHLNTERFLGVYERMTKNDHHGARALWATLETLVPLLFKEANPMPIKHCLWRQGLISSPECRLPLTRISDALADELDHVLMTDR